MSTQFAVLTCRTIIHQVALIFSSFFTTLLPFLPLRQHQFPRGCRTSPRRRRCLRLSPRLLDVLQTSPLSTLVHPRMTDFAPLLVVTVAAFTLEYSYRPTVRAIFAQRMCRSALNGTAHGAIRSRMTTSGAATHAPCRDVTCRISVKEPSAVLCISVRVRRIIRNLVSKLVPNFLCMLPVAIALSIVALW